MKNLIMSVTIDTECDKSPTWANSDPLTFRSVTEGIPEKLQPLFNEFDIKPTYFLSPEVIEDRRCKEVLNLIKNDCELGTHLHADFIEPEKNCKNLNGFNADAFQTDFSKEIEFEKLKNLSSLFENAFRKKPLVFRAGRYAANVNTINSLIRLGYKVDSSFTPHIKWKGPKGNWIDHTNSPEQPYFINQNDIYKSSKGGLLEVPVTIVESRKYFIRKKNLWLRPKFSILKEINKIIDYVIKRYAYLDQVFLTMMFHSQEVIPNASPYTKSEREVLEYINFLYDCFSLASRRGIKFMTLEEIYNLLSEAKSDPNG